METYIFIDIETVAQFPSFNALNANNKALWIRKISNVRGLGIVEPSEANGFLYEQKAGIFAEFSQVVCISIGHVLMIEDKYYFRTKSFAGRDEKEILTQFSTLCAKKMNRLHNQRFVGHNIREFDFPFLARRMIIGGIPLPPAFKLAGKKPWEVKHLLDTLEMWKFGDYKNYISLNLLSEILDVPSPKVDMDGSQVHQVYWGAQDLEKIRLYCEKDVFTTAMVFYKLNQIQIPQLLEVSSV